MNFCAKCGRERSGDARYCGGCGTEFAAASADADTPPTDDSAGGDPQPSVTVEAQWRVLRRCHGWDPPAEAHSIGQIRPWEPPSGTPPGWSGNRMPP